MIISKMETNRAQVRTDDFYLLYVQQNFNGSIPDG